MRGLVRIKSFTADPMAVASYGPVSDEAGTRSFALNATGVQKGVVLAQIEGIADRDAAEALKGVRLYVDRDRLPQPEEEEFYHADLLGLDAVLPDGSPLGKVSGFHDYGAGESLEIARTGGTPVLVPFTKAAVPVIDLAARRVVIDPPAGLLDNAAPDGEAS